jgi:hypothetical protein
MQFKNPAILYFLALLIIPIIVHLFQLQKFTKVPFTNVAFLQQLTLQNRKSSRIKKWLILGTRMLLFSAILFAFSQPYLSEQINTKQQVHFIYLDNSYSSSSKGERGNLLKVAAQDIIQYSPKKSSYTLMTNNSFEVNLTQSELKKSLLNIKNTSKKVKLSTVLLKINKLQKNKSNTLYKTSLISDFQDTYEKEFTNVTRSISLIKLTASTQNNLSIDSVAIASTTVDNSIVKALIRNQGKEQNNVPITLYNGQKLISKQSFSIDKNSTKTITFEIDKRTDFLGKLELTFSDTFIFDNQFLFAVNPNEKINILSIGNDSNYLSKIYNTAAFKFTQSTLESINYNQFEQQQLIILNELKNIPVSLQNSLLEFSIQGGNLVIIPNTFLELSSYASFFRKLGIGSISSKINTPLKMTRIHYEHPFFKDVFNNRVENFQYPISQNHYPTSFFNSNHLISFENMEGFLKEVRTKTNRIFWVANSLERAYSNFINSPLVVPVFYNFGQLSLAPTQLYYPLGQENKIEIKSRIEKDEILSLKNNENSWIPLQQQFQNKVVLTTRDHPENRGFYTVTKKNIPLKTLAFNNPTEESMLSFLDTNTLVTEYPNISVFNSVKDLFKEISEKNEVHWLWKWFLALAIVSLLLEILILKFFKS